MLFRSELILWGAAGKADQLRSLSALGPYWTVMHYYASPSIWLHKKQWLLGVSFARYMHYNSVQAMTMKHTRKSANALSASADSESYLRRLGERVRTMRSRRGMARRILAQQARVSERYLAQLESGQGNCSIVLLRRIARALGLPIEELVYDRPDRPVEALLVAQFLERLSPAALEEARELLQRRFEIGRAHV